MRKWIILSVITVSAVTLLFVVYPAKSRLQSYYSGDAISYQDELYITTANTGSLEVFKLTGKKLGLLASVRPYDARLNKYNDFYDAKLVEEDGNLFVYAVSNYTIYKYEVSGNSLNLIKQSSNTYWEWYNRIDKFGDNIVTVSAKGVKIYNSNLDVINAYDFKNADAPYNVSGDNPNFLLSVNEAANAVQVYDRETRSVLTTIPLNFEFKKGNRRAYQDGDGNVYVVDDAYARKYDLSGKLLADYKHLDYQGFDIAASENHDSVFFTNGVGVVKLDKNMKLIKFAWTTNLGGHSSWAMGMKVVYNQGDKVVVFNNTNIIVLDDKLNKIDSIMATKEADVYPEENLFLNLDNHIGSVGANIVATGGGYLPNEALTVYVGDATSTTAVSDSRGRFTSNVKVPELKKGGNDIKVVGTKSKLSYSTSFKVQ